MSLPPTYSNFAVCAYFEMTVFVMTYVRHSRAGGNPVAFCVRLHISLDSRLRGSDDAVIALGRHTQKSITRDYVQQRLNRLTSGAWVALTNSFTRTQIIKPRAAHEVSGMGVRQPLTSCAALYCRLSFVRSARHEPTRKDNTSSNRIKPSLWHGAQHAAFGLGETVGSGLDHLDVA